jgi:hypothetical protein
MLLDHLLITGGIFIPPGHMGCVCLPGLVHKVFFLTRVLVHKVGPARIDSVFHPVDNIMGQPSFLSSSACILQHPTS